VLQLSPTYRIFRPRKLPKGNNWVYDSFIQLFDSQVMLSPVGPTKITFTKTISFPLKLLTSRSSILTVKSQRSNYSLLPSHSLESHAMDHKHTFEVETHETHYEDSTTTVTQSDTLQLQPSQ